MAVQNSDSFNDEIGNDKILDRNVSSPAAKELESRHSYEQSESFEDDVGSYAPKGPSKERIDRDKYIEELEMKLEEEHKELTKLWSDMQLQDKKRLTQICEDDEESADTQCVESADGFDANDKTREKKVFTATADELCPSGPRVEGSIDGHPNGDLYSPQTSMFQNLPRLKQKLSLALSYTRQTSAFQDKEDIILATAKASTPPCGDLMDEMPELSVNPEPPCRTVDQPCKSIHSDVPDGSIACELKNQIFVDEVRLLIYCVFGIGTDDYSAKFPHHTKFCPLEVVADHSDTLHFTLKTNPKHEYFVGQQSEIDELFRLDYFKRSKYKIFLYRVNPSPDEIPRKFIDVDYAMGVLKMAKQSLPIRFRNQLKCEDNEEVHAICEKGNAGRNINVHVHQGDQSRTARTMVEGQSRYDEKSNGNNTHIGGSKTGSCW